MFCDECHINKPYIYMVKVINGRVLKTHLCEDCAKKFWDSFLSLDEFSKLPQFLSNAFDPGESYLLEDFEEESEMTCPTCSIKLSDFRKSGRLGCSDCYKSFEKKLSPLLKKIHGRGEHMGKIPSHLDEQTRLELKLVRLRHDLKVCVKEEEYERAAKVRDEIKDIEEHSSLRVG